MKETDYPTAPRVAVGAVIFHDGKVLLVRRGHAPSAGKWAIPGGRVELGESLQAAAEREVREEMGITVSAGAPIYAFDLVEKDATGRCLFHYVIVDLLAEYLGGEPHPGDDASDARWVDPDDLGDLDVNDDTRRFLRQWPKKDMRLEAEDAGL